MEHLSTHNVLLALTGILLHILMKIHPHVSKKTFNWNVFARENFLTITMSIIATFVLLILSEDVLITFGIQYSESTISIMAFTAGYLNQSLLRNLIKMVIPNKK